MARERAVFVCQECGHQTLRWQGRCPGCGSWGTMVEERVPAPSGRGAAGRVRAGAGPGAAGRLPVPIAEVDPGEAPRVVTGIGELDRVLGGGLVPGSMVLVGGDPGVGKSTLLLQAAHRLALQGVGVLYVSGEESARQVRLRADRLGALAPGLYVASETDMDQIEENVRALSPGVLVVDSIQTVFRPDLASAPGSVTQVREAAADLLRLAKSTGVTVLVVGHVTKEGAIAGPRVLEHIVDTVLYFEGERQGQLRVLRAVKNRFGSTGEIGLFEMRDGGLAEVPGASQVLLAERPAGAAGSVVVPCVEGTRPLLVEVQALVSATPYPNPRRTATGVDLTRVQLILAVLEKRVGLHLGGHDAYVKVAGGVRVDEPAVDLGLAVALASSFREVAADPHTVVLGEVGLAGEVRAVSRLAERLYEAEKLGFRRAVIPAGNLRTEGRRGDIEWIGVRTVAEGLEAALGGSREEVGQGW